MKTCNESVKTGKLLRSSYQSCKIIFDNNPIPMWLVSKDDLSIIYVNKAVVMHYGYAVSELQQMTIKDIELKDDIEEQFVNSQRMAKHIKKCGAIMHVKMILQDIEIKGQQLILVSTIDTTNEFNIRKSLHNSKANLQSILKISDIGYILFDKELRIFSFNENAAKFAYNKYNIRLEKGACVTDSFTTDKFPRFVYSMIKALGGSCIKYEIDYKLPDEVTLWYKIQLVPIRDNHDKIIGIMISINDITERENAQKALCIAYNKIKDQITSMQTITWKQSHLIRQPLANLRGLLLMLTENPSDEQVLTYIQSEFEKMDAVVIEMANDVLKII